MSGGKLRVGFGILLEPTPDGRLWLSRELTSRPLKPPGCRPPSLSATPSASAVPVPRGELGGGQQRGWGCRLLISAGFECRRPGVLG